MFGLTKPYGVFIKLGNSHSPCDTSEDAYLKTSVTLPCTSETLPAATLTRIDVALNLLSYSLTESNLEAARPSHK